MNETFTAYVTKYALSEGITTIQARLCRDISETMIEHCGRQGIFFHRHDWHRTPEAALARAEEMRKAKIASLDKSIAKLRKLKFEVPA